MKVRDSLILIAVIGGLALAGFVGLWNALGKVRWEALAPQPRRLPVLPGPPKPFDPAALRRQKNYKPVSLRPAPRPKPPPKPARQTSLKEVAPARPAPPRSPWKPKARLQAVPTFDERIEPRSEPQSTGASAPAEPQEAPPPKKTAPKTAEPEEPPLEAPSAPRSPPEPQEAPQAGEYETSEDQPPNE